jgi:parallel beta-helix repeat protein
MKNSSIVKCLAVGIILLFVGTCIVPAIAQATEKPLLTSRGNWLYVGGSGPGNYTRIQDAINNSHDGETVFVYSGLYTERIVIPNAINLIGESKNTTIISAEIQDYEILITLSSSDITISGFTLRSTGVYYGSLISNSHYYGYLNNITISDNIFRGKILWVIYFTICNFCTITKNTFSLNCSIGIYMRNGLNWTITNNTMNAVGWIGQGMELEYTSHCIVSNNTFISIRDAGLIIDSQFGTISNNYFFNISKAIVMEGSYKNSILSNLIDNPTEKMMNSKELTGILLIGNNNASIVKNIITHCRCGIIVEDSYFSNISMNTFMKNMVHARFYQKRTSYTIWNQNYWGRPRVLPKPIFGIENMYRAFPDVIQFDRHPAKEPYDIPEVR